jgi:NADH dehydrogenase [ubiquinone] 1 alpha subcomplex assembly factor 5
MKEVRRILKPDGCFMFAMVGGSTLPELRSCLVLAEMERDGGVSPHVGPFIDFPDVGSLLSSAGFQLPTIDIDTLQLAYPDAAILMEHLQRMGESNACINRRNRVHSDLFLATAALYQQLHQLDSTNGSEEEECVVATVQVIYGIGWTPHMSQPKPLPRGSATKKIGQL